MSTTTTRNSLVKPAYSDAADIAVINTNYDTIDASFAKCNWASAADPAATDDSGDGYAIGSMWFNTTGHKLYVAETVGVGTATWRLIYPGGVSPVISASDPTVNDDSGDGYAIGQIWYNTTGNKYFVAKDVTLGAAVWVQIPTTGTAWDIGAVEIRALTLQADATTGTAPLTITSETMVNNLNADMVDGYDASAFPLLAGRAGSQTLYGGTAASDGLVLASTSDATKGNVTVPDGNLVVGTKGVTSGFGIAIQEGAAAAPNVIQFMDGDGTTPLAGVWKTSSDNLAFGAGDATNVDIYVRASDGLVISTTGYSTNGVCTANNGFLSTKTTTDPATSSSTYNHTSRPTYTATASLSYFGIYGSIFPEVQSTKTNSSTIYSFYTECMRNHNGAATNDDGTLGNLVAMQAYFGHFSSNASMAGTTTNAYGVRISPYINKGTITNMYGLLVESPSAGGTLTNGWPIYTNWNAQHYFGGDIYTVGNCSALTFTDRTPGYDGDGIADLKKVKNKEGKVDHDTLPEFAKKTIEGEDKKPEAARDLGAMISILVKAVQQIADKLDDLDARVKKLEKPSA